MKQSENCKQPPARTYSSNAYDMSIPRCIATLAIMPKSALNKSWRYILREHCIWSDATSGVVFDQRSSGVPSRQRLWVV